jgi:hypothetical protein
MEGRNVPFLPPSFCQLVWAGDSEGRREGWNRFHWGKPGETHRRRDFPAVTGVRIPVFLDFERVRAFRSAVRGIFSSAVSIEEPLVSIACLSVAIAELSVSIA